MASLNPAGGGPITPIPEVVNSLSTIYPAAPTVNPEGSILLGTHQRSGAIDAIMESKLEDLRKMGARGDDSDVDDGLLFLNTCCTSPRPTCLSA